jgi:hypothetical protein
MEFIRTWLTACGIFEMSHHYDGRRSDEADLAESFSLVPHSSTWMLCNKEQN